MNKLTPERPDLDFDRVDPAPMRTPAFQARRRLWPGILVATLIGAVVAALVVSSLYDRRSLGQRLDASVAAGSASVQQQVDGLRAGAAEAARDGALAGNRVAGAMGDAGITAAVKAALATDPALSALQIEVSTEGGVVSLTGPAPSEDARQRASVLAAAPQGVLRVDNRLVLAR